MRQVDISRVGERRLDPVRVSALLRALGRHCATEAKLSTLAADTGGSESALDERTVSGYLRALERLMVIEDQPAWAPHLRSRARLCRAPRRLLRDLGWFGQVFESPVIRDQRVYCQVLDGEVFHYRDDYGLEVVAIVQLRDERWGVIEIWL